MGTRNGVTMIELSQYTEINLLGISILFTILIIDHRHHGYNSGDIHQNFINMIIMNAVILLCDNSVYLLRGIASAGIIGMTYILCCTCFILHTWFGYEWLCYIIGFVYPRFQLTKVGRLLIMIPSLLANVFVLLTPLNGWVFYFTEENVYHRGPLILLTFIADAVYLAIAVFLLLKEYMNPNAIRRRNEYVEFILAPLPMLIGNILQICFYGLTIVWISSAVSLMIIYIEDQNQLSSRDALTGLYNRRQTDAQLSWELSRKRPDGDFLIVSMIDIDQFKSINDTYGHLKGDEALVIVAETLIENFRKTDFIGRYGGDEFLMIGHIKHRDDAPRIFQRLKNKLDAQNFSGAYPYNLSASIGYVVCDPHDSPTTDEVLNEADKKMYEVKIRRAKDYKKMNTDFTGIISRIE